MKEYLSQEQTIAAVSGLSPSRLSAFLEADLVRPTSSATGPLYRVVEIARLELLCDLAEHFDLQDDALGVVMGLIDQLHDARRHLHAMAAAMDGESHELRQRVGARYVGLVRV